MSQKNRSRPIGIKLRFTQQELQLVAEKMEQLGTTNREAYLRKMAIDGYVLKLDVPELKELMIQRPINLIIPARLILAPMPLLQLHLEKCSPTTVKSLMQSFLNQTAVLA